MTNQPTIDLFEAMYTSRSLRRLKPDPIPDDVIRKVIEAGTQAPSGANQQHWRFLAVTDPDKRAGLAEIYRKGAQEGQPSAGGDERSQRLRHESIYYLFDHMQDPPLLLLVCALRESMPPGYQPPPDIAKFTERSAPAGVLLAVQNMMLACRAHRLGTVPTTTHLLYEDEVKELLGIPPEVDTFVLLPIGYPIDKIGPVTRKPVEEVTFRNEWGNNWPGLQRT